MEHLLIKHTNFENEIPVFRFDQLTNKFPNLKRLILHIPELYVKEFRPSISLKQASFLRNIPNLHINILNQNIRLMPGKEIIQSLFWFTPRVTITTAHAKYCSLAYRNAFGVPLHFFSTFASPENYLYIPFKDKGNVILFSPDDDEKNLEVTIEF